MPKKERNTADNTSTGQGEGTSNGGGGDNGTMSRKEKVAPSVSLEGTILPDRTNVKP